MSRAPTSAMAYAQRRRDEEISTRDDLKSLIPEEYFRAEIEGSGNYNVSTKVMKAAEYYIQAQEQEKLAVAESPVGNGTGRGKAKEGKGKRKSMAEQLNEEGEEPRRVVPSSREARTVSEEVIHGEMIRGQAITTAPPSAFVSALPEIQQLRQCARRLVAVAEGKAAEAEAAGPGEMSEELKTSMEKGSDLMIDLIQVIEQEGWSEKMKAKWEEERAVWEGRVRLD